VRQKIERSIVAGIILTALPILVVVFAKKMPYAAVLDTPQSRIIGSPKARLKIIEYSDFQCPSCAHVEPTIHTVLDAFNGRVVFVFKYFPLTMAHKNSLPAAHAAACAEQQNKFWQYHDRLFATQPSWAPLPDATTTFVSIAEDLHLNVNDFKTCFQDPVTLTPVLQDMADGKRLDIHSTPTFIFGDERMVGNVFEADGARAVDKELRK
jgi:protein-disulfide isomerase